MTDEEVQQHKEEEELELEVLRLESLKEQRKEIQQEIDDIEAYLAKAIDDKMEFDGNPGEIVRAKVVQGHTDKFEVDLIQTEYPGLWWKISRPILDKNLYVKAVRDGSITPEMHNEIFHEVPNKPWVRITRYHRGNAIEASE